MAGVMGLINQKTGADQGSPNAELYALAAKQTYSSCSAERGNGAPVTTSTCLFNDIDSGTNAMACDYDAFVTTPSPNCKPIHSGDVVGVLPGYSAGLGYDQATGLGSLNVANVVNAWPTKAGTGAATVTVTPALAGINANNTLDVTVKVASKATGGEAPTGTVTLTASGSTYTASGAISSSGSVTFTIPANSLPGTAAGQLDTLTASYGGDVLYAAKTGTGTVTVTVVALLTPTVTVAPASATLDTNAALNVVVTVAGSSITPTGTVQLAGGGYTSTSEQLTNGSYTFAIPANTLSGNATGESDTLTATYSGDGSYGTGTGMAAVTVTESTFSMTATNIASLAPGATTGNVSTISVAAVSGYTGTVTLTCQEESDASPTTGDGATCSIPTTAVPMGGSASATITTTAASTTTTQLTYPRMGNGRKWAGSGGGAVLALLLFLLTPARRRRWQSMLGLFALMVALGSMVACGGGGSGGGGGSTVTDPGTAAGTYTFTVVATGNPSVTPTVQTTFTVTVQ
jgi:hypothetical protein